MHNARKIYGGDPRPIREFKRIERWDAIAAKHGLDPADWAPRDELWRQLTWQAGALGLLGYLLFHAVTTWGLFLLAIPTLLVLAALVRTATGLAWPRASWRPPAWSGRVLPLLVAGGTWFALWWRRRQGEPLDIVVLVLAGIVLGVWAVGHLWRVGGLLGLLSARISPPRLRS